MSAHITMTTAYDLIDKIYECVSEPEGWTNVLYEISRLFQFHHSAISDFSVQSQTVKIIHHDGIEPEFKRDLEYNALLNPMIHSRSSCNASEPYSALRYFGIPAFRASPWYRRAVLPRDIEDVAMQVLTSSASHFSAYIAMRREPNGGIQAIDLDNIGMIAAHITRAHRLSDLLGDLQQRSASLVDAFDSLSMGLIFVDLKGRIVHSNYAASRFLDEATAARRCRDHISAHHPGAAKELRDALSAALADAGVGSQLRSGILLPGYEGKDLIAWIMPLASNLRSKFGYERNARLAIFLKHADTALPHPDNAFARRYQLTEGETRVLVLLLQGLTVAESAAICNLTYNTMKTHLRNLFRKTDTTRQAELLNKATAFLPPILQQDAQVAAPGLSRTALAPRPAPAGLIESYKRVSKKTDTAPLFKITN